MTKKFGDFLGSFVRIIKLFLEAEMEPYQEQVMMEKAELDERLRKLDEFGRTDAFAALPSDEQGRLNRQHSIMEDDREVRGEGIVKCDVYYGADIVHEINDEKRNESSE